MPDEPTATAERAVERLLAAVHDRDADAAGACFAPGARYRNVPHEPVVGPQGVADLLRPVLARSESVHWEVVTAAYAPGRAWLERVDRFRVDGVEHAVACNAVVEVDPGTGLITEFRDYLDLGEWRTRTTGVFT